MHSFQTRNDLISTLTKNCIFAEIGVFQGQNIREIITEHKDGVDPGAEDKLVPEINYPITSDEFFQLIKGHDIKYDIIFIDGLHHVDQVDKDISNSLNHLTKNGTIVLHDCNPPEYETQLVPRVTGYWNGDVWKSVAKVRCTNPNVQLNVVDTDWGVGVLQFGSQNLYDKENLDKVLDYYYLDQNREEILNLISIEDFYIKYKK